jgi:hypothetical protein
MPTLVKELDPSSAYTFCPICRQNGNNSSPIQRDGHVLKCNFGHSVSGSDLQRFGADMVKSGDVFIEQPTITDIKWSIWVNPTVKERLEKKLAGRIMVTIATLLAALSDDSLVMITGEQAAKLRAMGIHNGADMLAKAESEVQTAKERDDCLNQIERFMQVMKAAQIPGA